MTDHLFNPKQLKQQFEHELYESVIPFWERFSPDAAYGGYFNCLDFDGSVYDSRKHVWLQGRQAWMFSKLYRTIEQKQEWLNLAQSGIDFLLDNAYNSENGRVYFEMARDGKPIYLQRKIFSECFFIMALAEFSRATGEEKYMTIAKEELERVWEWTKDISKIGRPVLEGQSEMNSLAIPMILLNLIEEVAGDDDVETYTDEIDQCIKLMLKHVHEDKKLVLENVGPDGEYMSNSYDGRMLVPGHAIEAGWFLQHWALRLKRDELSKTAANIIRWSFDKGWDEKFGGLFYFLDSKGYSPTQLEWNKKLWWPHTEALYGLLQNVTLFDEKEDLLRFNKLRNYTFTHFPDAEHGEWFGYLNRDGSVSQRFKGGPYKGCFHVPRALYLCNQWIEEYY